ncbi:Paired amphipathic helix protein Sin3a [Homalodisca vitripennis]|nr:Paired amphipathic helix protein Sin3a [Homalodisca vitripennis]
MFENVVYFPDGWTFHLIVRRKDASKDVSMFKLNDVTYDKYKKFLEILLTYQKEKQNLKEGVGADSQSTGNKQMTEAEVYSQVTKLFEDHNDLLTEFVQSLIDAPNRQTQLLIIYGISTEGSLASLPIPNSCHFESCAKYFVG